MIVVMKTNATENQIVGVQKAIRELGFKDHRIHGEERNVVAVLGHVYPELVDELGVLEGVDTVVRISKPYKLASREVNPYDTIVRVGPSGKPVLLKRGMSATIEEWLLAAEYVLSHGNRDVILCERGIRTFETATRFTFDVNAIPLVKKLSHLPLIGDPSHATGKWDLVEPVALAAIAAGADGLEVEVHPNPDHALSDGAQSLTPKNFAKLMDRARTLGDAIGRPVAPAYNEPVAARKAS